MYDEYALIKKSTLTATANAIRAQKGTSDLIDPANFPTEIEGITGGVSSSDFYTVNFYDYDQELIETHTAKVGNQIGSPLSYTPNNWRDTEGSITNFPLTITEGGTVIGLYASIETVEMELYTHFGVDKTVYPYLLINIQNNGADISLDVYFSKQLYTGDNPNYPVPQKVLYCNANITSYGLVDDGNVNDFEDVSKIVNIIKTEFDTTSLLTDKLNGEVLVGSSGYFYTNFSDNVGAYTFWRDLR